MMNELVLTLPKEIQDKIGMFNHEHRHMMKAVLKDMIYTKFPTQTKEYWISKLKSIVRHEHDSIRYALYCGYCLEDKSIYLINTTYCGEKCRMDHDRELYEEAYNELSDYYDYDD
jgi:hypothetical protein